MSDHSRFTRRDRCESAGGRAWAAVLEPLEGRLLLDAAVGAASAMGLRLEDGQAAGWLSADVAALAGGTIEGVVWNDLDGDGEKDGGEPGLGDWRVYLDSNLNGQWDAGEDYEISGADGAYAFVGLDAGTYVVAEEPQAGWTQTVPTGGAAGALGATAEAILSGLAAAAPIDSPAGPAIDTAWIDGPGPSALRNLDLSGAAAARSPEPAPAGTGVFGVYVEEGLLSSIQSAVDTYTADLAAEGYQVTVEEFSGTAENLRAALQGQWTTNGLEGALFVGDLPALYFTSEDSFYTTPTQETYPHDLYFMDLDGTYVLNATGLDEHTDGSGDVGPEIYVSRITTGNLGGILPGTRRGWPITIAASCSPTTTGATRARNRWTTCTPTSSC